MSIITWLHISDLHMCGPMTGWDANRILASLKDDFKKLQDQHQLCPDLIFVTGDIAYGEIPGYPIEEQFQEAGTLLEEIRESFSPSIPIDNVFIVPGNHDVNRDSVTPDQTDWLDRQTDLNRIFDLVRSHNIQWSPVSMKFDFDASLGDRATTLTNINISQIVPNTPLVLTVKVGAGFPRPFL